MFDNIFNEQMTSNQARLALFRAVEGKTKAEIEQIMREYDRVFPAIHKRESELSAQGWFID